MNTFFEEFLSAGFVGLLFPPLASRPTKTNKGREGLPLHIIRYLAGAQSIRVTDCVNARRDDTNNEQTLSPDRYPRPRPPWHFYMQFHALCSISKFYFQLSILRINPTFGSKERSE